MSKIIDDIKTTNNIDITGTLIIRSTNGYNGTTGALIVEGGVAIYKSLNVSSNINTDDSYYMNGTVMITKPESNTLFIGSDPTSYSSGINTVSIGIGSLGSTVAGSGNVSIGKDCMSVSTGSSNCVCIGRVAGNALSTGDRCVIIGDSAGFSAPTIGSDHTLIGYLTAIHAGDASNCIALGNSAACTASNQCMIGNASITELVPNASASCNLGSTTNPFNNLYTKGDLILNSGSTDNGTITLSIPNDDVTNYSITFPRAQGTVNQILLNDGSGNLSWGELPSSTTSSELAVTGSTTIGGTLNVGDDMAVAGTSGSTSTSSGALVVTGGVGIGENLNVGGKITIFDTTLANDETTTGALIVAGGIAVGKNIDIATTLEVGDTSTFKGAVTITDTTQSTSTNNGALIVQGGAGIYKGLTLGGKLSLSIRTVSGSTSLGDDYILNVSNTATITLPDITDDQYNGVAYLIIKQTANTVTVTTQAADKIIDSGSEVNSIDLDGAIGERMHVISNGDKWFVI